MLATTQPPSGNVECHRDLHSCTERIKREKEWLSVCSRLDGCEVHTFTDAAISDLSSKVFVADFVDPDFSAYIEIVTVELSNTFR